MKKTTAKNKENTSVNVSNISLGEKFLKKKNEELNKAIIQTQMTKGNVSDSIEIKSPADSSAVPNGTIVNKEKIKITDRLKNIFSGIKKFLSSFKKKEAVTSHDGVQERKSDPKKSYSNKELMEKKKKKSKITVNRYEHQRHLKDYLEKAGYSISEETKISKRVNISATILVSMLSLYIFYSGVIREDTILFILTQIILSWTIILPAIIVIFWIIFYFVIDFKIYNRRKELEEVLPDFLQLTSANINAGMPLDQALWYAVRPRFGILAKEIEEVAKSTLVGEDLGDALSHFSKRYDSIMLKRTVNLMLEGLEAGGEMGPLLSKISVDIQETRIIRKDMAANVTTYVIFISFATLIAAPFLFALSNQLLSIIQTLISNINIPQGAASGSMMSMSFSKDAISMANFKIFAISTLTVTSFFSAVIISTIRYGNVKDGIKYIPIFIIVSVIVYLIATNILGYFLGGML